MSLKAFIEAEAMQAERQPQYPLLYSQVGYRYCELLLEQFAISDPRFVEKNPEQSLARIREVRNRAETDLKTADAILDIAFDHLTLGRTWLLEFAILDLRFAMEEDDATTIANQQSAIENATSHLNESVSLLRQAGTQHWIPIGLLHRAALWRAKAFAILDLRLPIDEPETQIANRKSAIENALRDLSEAETIAERGSMLVWQIEATLERTRLYLALSSANSAPLRFKKEDQNAEAQRTQREHLEQAREKLAEARRLVKQTEKPYQPYVPDWANWEPPEYIGVFKKGDVVGYHCRNHEIERLQNAIDSLSASSPLAG